MKKCVTIDIITHDPNTDEFVLYLVEDGPWPESSKTWDEILSVIQERVLSAADVAIDGYLADKQPDSRGKRVRIQVDSPNGCPEQLQVLVSAIDDFLATDQSYSSAVRKSNHISGLRVVTGKQLGRFH
jgi:hypothetical protein